MKYSSKQFLALLLSVTMAITPATGVWAENVSPEVSTEKTTEAVTEKATEKAVETVAEKVTEKTEENETKTSTEKAEEIQSQEKTETEVTKEETEKNETKVETDETVSVTDTEQEENSGETVDTNNTDAETAGTELAETEITEEAGLESETEIKSETQETAAETEATTEKECVKSVEETAEEQKKNLAAEEEESEQSVESKNEPEQFTTAVDNSTTLMDGVYVPDNFIYYKADGKTSKTTISCSKITVTDGKSYATISISSSAYSYVKASGNKYTGVTDEEADTATFTIPVQLGVDNKIIGHTTKMKSEIAYYICASITDAVVDTDESKKEAESQKEAELITTEVDNSTTLSDGIYTPSSFTFSKANGGASKTGISCSQIIVKDGKAYATITIASSAYNYIKASGKKYTGEIDETVDTATFTIPIQLGANNTIVGYTTKMLTEIAYLICATVEVIESPEESTTPVVDNSTTLADGVYVADSFTFSKADGTASKTSISCNSVTVISGKAYATIVIDSSAYSYVKASGNTYSGRNDEAAGTSTFTIPIKLGENNTIIGYTTKMSKEISYVICAVAMGTIKNPETESETNDTEEETEPAKLQNGNYKVTVDSSQNKMFRVVDCVLTYKDGQMVTRITMSGVGSDILYMGTAVNAPADSANWIKASGTEKNSEGKDAYYFEIPVVALDTEIALSSHAQESGKWSDRVLIFQSAGMTLINADGTTESESTTEKETEKTNDKTADKESKYEADTSGATSVVDSSTGLADGVYTPDKFSWSGGSGRTSISCTKVTVSGGQAYATIVFGSSNYGYVKANGRKYYPTYSGGTSIFTIPVKLNANNRIIGMTTAMSAAHEVTYTIYIYIAGADKASDSKEKELNKDGLSEEVPEIIGLEYTDEEEIEYAEYFKIYYYDQGITLIEVDMASDTDKPEKEKADAEESAEEAAAEEMTGAVAEEELAEETAEAVSEEELAEETTEETKDATTIISELYQENVVRYLVVPETAEVPVGLEKEMIIVNLPVESVYTDSEQAMETLEKLKLEELVTVEGETAEKPEYKELILNKCDLAILSDEFLWDEEKEELTLEEQSELLYEIAERLTTLSIPAIVDRSADEKSEEAAAEWAKVYGVLLGCSDAAEKIFQETIQD